MIVLRIFGYVWLIWTLLWAAAWAIIPLILVNPITTPGMFWPAGDILFAVLFCWLIPWLTGVTITNWALGYAAALITGKY